MLITLLSLLASPSLDGPAAMPAPWHVAPLAVQDSCACAPNLDEFYRKKKAALELYEAAAQQTLHSTDDLQHFLEDALSGTEEGTEIKGPIVLSIWLFKKNRLNQIEKGVAALTTKLRWLRQAKAATTALETADLAAWLLLVDQLYQLHHYVHEGYVELEDAKKMVAAANAQYDEAVAALDKALRQSADCEKARPQRMQPAQSVADRAHKLMESWENNGYLYKDPSGEILDARAAFQRATEILSGKSSSRRARRPRLIPVALIGRTGGQIPVTMQQLEAAIGEINRGGVRLFKDGMDKVLHWRRANAEIQAHITQLEREIVELDKKMASAQAHCGRCGPATPAPRRPGQTGGGQCR